MDIEVTKPTYFITKAQKEKHVKYVIKEHIEIELTSEIMIGGKIDIEIPSIFGPDIPDCHLDREEQDMVIETYKDAGWSDVSFDDTGYNICFTV